MGFSTSQGKVIVGQKDMVERILIGLLTGATCSSKACPGLAKTLTVESVCEAASAQFSRIQFTPDLLPADVGGHRDLQPAEGRVLRQARAPSSPNLVLADEINRAPAKVQSALLEAMQELQVTIGDTTYALPRPFMVMATQNPIEQEGTYPLPEAQLDRFMLHVLVDYPSRDEERRHHGAHERRCLGGPNAPAKEGTPIVAQVDPRSCSRHAHHQSGLGGRAHQGLHLERVAATRDPSKVSLHDMKDMVAHGASSNT